MNKNTIRLLKLALVSFVISSCQHVTTKTFRDDKQTKSAGTANSNISATTPATNQISAAATEHISPSTEPSISAEDKITEQGLSTNVTAPLPPSTPPQLAKVGLILGPGSMRSYAEIGVLQSLVKAKMPIDSIVGIEWGALVAATFSIHGQSNDVEWQLMKIKENAFNKKGLLDDSGPQDVSGLLNYFNDIFQQTKIEQAQIPFVCPAFDIVKKQVFWMKRGEFSKAIPYCLASPPLFKPYQNNVPAIDLKLTVDYLKSKGINYIILVNVIPAANPLLGGEEKSTEGFRDQIIWSQWQMNLQKQSNLVNYTIEVPLDRTPIQDATKRRELIKKGRDIGQSAATILATRLGF